MDEVLIQKKRLLEKLKQNRDEHKEIYETALEGWKEEVIKGLEDALVKAKKGEEYITQLDLTKPVHHLKEYDEIIDRVEWHEKDLIELDIQEFNCFVRDKWDWSHWFLKQATSYSSTSSSSSSSTSSLIKTKLAKFE